MAEIFEIDILRVNGKEVEKIGECAEQNASNCNFVLGELCEFCSVWINKNVPRDCLWVRKN